MIRTVGLPALSDLQRWFKLNSFSLIQFIVIIIIDSVDSSDLKIKVMAIGGPL